MSISREIVQLMAKDKSSARSTGFLETVGFFKVAALFHSLIGRFRYLFTVAITLSKEKKNFHDLVVQIGNRYNPNHILLEDKEE